MKNPFSNETVKSAAIVIGSAAAFIALSKGVSILRKKFGGNAKLKAIFGSAENELTIGALARRRNKPTDCAETVGGCECEASCEAAN